MAQPYSHVARAIQSLVACDAHRATLYVSDRETVKVTNRNRRARAKNLELVVTIGRPNWHERQRIKQFKKVGEPFPVKKVQLQYLPRKR